MGVGRTPQGPSGSRPLSAGSSGSAVRCPLGLLFWLVKRKQKASELWSDPLAQAFLTLSGTGDAGSSAREAHR